MDDNYNPTLGCMDCGSLFELDDVYGGACPMCESTNITTFADLISYVREHRDFMESMGLLDDQ